MEESLDRLSLKEALLLKELELVGGKIEYVRKFTLSEQQKVISTPSSSQSQVQAIPEQTAPGKESANPLMVVGLPKIQTEVQTSLNRLVSKPNQGIQHPDKSKEKSLVEPHGSREFKSHKNYYVVYNGINAGIYDDWSTAELAVKGISGFKHKKFSSFQEARVSADIFTTAQMKPPLDLISSAAGLKPTYEAALERKSRSMTTLGKILPTQKQVEHFEDDYTGDTSFSSFDSLYKFGREATEEQFVEKKLFTTDKMNISYFNFYPNAHMDLIFEAYVNGLVNLIYPSKNLLEINRFPKEFKDAVRKYRFKCVKNVDKDIFIKVQSTVPFWDKDDDLEQAFHYVQLGIVKEKIYIPSTQHAATLEKKDLQEIAIQKMENIADKIFNIPEDSNIKINLATNFCLVTSQSTQKMDEGDRRILHHYKSKLSSGKVFGHHYPTLCQKLRRIIERKELEYSCSMCAVPATQEKEEESSLVGQRQVQAADKSQVGLKTKTRNRVSFDENIIDLKRRKN